MSPSTKRLLIALVIISIAFYFLDRASLLNPLRGVGEIVTTPIIKSIWGGEKSIEDVAFWSKGSSRVSPETPELASLSAQLTMLTEENQALRKELEGKEQGKSRLILAHILGGERYIVIDRGERHGVQTGMTVTRDSMLVGRVIRATPGTATVLLPTDPDANVPAWTPKLTRGIVRGSFGRTIIFGQVLQADPLSSGEIVLTTGEDGYAQNLAIGRIVRVTSEPREVYKQAELTPLLDYRKLRTVFVVLENN